MPNSLDPFQPPGDPLAHPLENPQAPLGPALPAAPLGPEPAARPSAPLAEAGFGQPSEPLAPSLAGILGGVPEPTVTRPGPDPLNAITHSVELPGEQPLADPFRLDGASESAEIAYRIEAPEGFAIQDFEPQTLDPDHLQLKVESDLETDIPLPSFADGPDLPQAEVNYSIELPHGFRHLRVSRWASASAAVDADATADEGDQHALHITNRPMDDHRPNLTYRDRVFPPRLERDPGFSGRGYDESRRRFVRMGRGSGGNPFERRRPTTRKRCIRCGARMLDFDDTCPKCGLSYCRSCGNPKTEEGCSNQWCNRHPSNAGRDNDAYQEEP